MGGGESHKSFWWGIVRERDYFEDPNIGGRIIFKRFFRKWNGVMNWIDLNQDTERSRALANAVMNLRVP
jgi:hypothetical protein